jgi:ribosomal protein S15P/S13E
MKEQAQQAQPTTGLSADQLGMLISTIEKLHQRLDADREDDGSRTALVQILDTHGAALKAALRPENQLHPDVSYANPEGERAHPRARLKRNAFLLGIPLQPDSLRKVEVDALNRFTESLEIPGKKWQARILRDAGGGEVLYISLPFRSFDDLRHVGGLLDILNAIHAEGKRPDTNDVIADRLEKAERLIAQLQASQVAQTADAPPPAA